jgi:hypothetical protein
VEVLHAHLHLGVGAQLRLHVHVDLNTHVDGSVHPCHHLDRGVCVSVYLLLHLHLPLPMRLLQHRMAPLWRLLRSITSSGPAHAAGGNMLFSITSSGPAHAAGGNMLRLALGAVMLFALTPRWYSPKCMHELFHIPETRYQKPGTRYQSELAVFRQWRTD